MANAKETRWKSGSHFYQSNRKHGAEDVCLDELLSLHSNVETLSLQEIVAP